MNWYDCDISSVFLGRAEINDICIRIASEINNEYVNKKLIMLCVLKGSCFFTCDLLKYINIPVNVEYIKASSYGMGAVSTGNVEIKYDTTPGDLSEYDVLIIEDILDTGNTLKALIEYIKNKNAKSVKLCVLLHKHKKNMAGNKIKIDYEGVKTEDEFFVGYGLDYGGYYRNLPVVAVLKDEKIKRPPG